MYTIGQMSQLCHVSARRLRHYETVGLLQPALVGENGYRYYSAEQLVSIESIVRLQGYGFTLTEIGYFLALDTSEQLQMLQAQQKKNLQQIQSLQASVYALAMDIRKREGNELEKEQEQIIVMMNPEQKVFGLKRRIRPENIHTLFEELYAEMAQRGLQRAGAAQLVYLDEKYDEDWLTVEAQVPVVGEHPDVQRMASQLCAVCRYQGPYEQIASAYAAMGRWLANHTEYHVVGAVIERFLNDERQVQSAAELETGLLFPVTRC